MTGYKIKREVGIDGFHDTYVKKIWKSIIYSERMVRIFQNAQSERNRTSEPNMHNK